MIDQMKLMIADIDGTLVSKGEDLLPETRNALIRLHNENVLLGIASGRAINAAMMRRYIQWSLPFQFDVIVGLNGGQLWDSDHPNVEYYHLLTPDTMKEILEMMAPLHINASIYEEDHMVSLFRDELTQESMRRNKTEVIDAHGDISRIYQRPNNNIIFRFFPEQEEAVMSHIHSHPSDKFTATITTTGIIEFMDPHVNKGMGLSKWSERSGIPLSQIMAFGDMDNDKELLKTAGWGVAMKNGSEVTKQMADAITEYTVEEDGLGRYIQMHWFNNI